MGALEGDLTYTQVAAGENHTVLLRSDGTAVACGQNDSGQCDLPALEGDLTYKQAAAGSHHTKKIMLQSYFDGAALRLVMLNGEEVCQVRDVGTARLANIRVTLLSQFRGRASAVDVVLPGGALLSAVVSQEPLALLAQFLAV